MADGFLERRQEDYEARKAAYLKKKRRQPSLKLRNIECPDDEAL